jgi:hypothetical protein
MSWPRESRLPHRCGRTRLPGHYMITSVIVAKEENKEKVSPIAGPLAVQLSDVAQDLERAKVGMVSSAASAGEAAS